MKGWKVATYLLYAGLIIWIVAPFVYLFLNSLKSNYELFSWPPEIFSLHTSMQYGPLTNYYGILIYWLVKGKAVVGSGYSRGAFPEYATDIPPALFNTAVIAFGVVALCLVLGTFSGYSLARLNFRGKEAVSTATLASQFIPAASIGIPLFYLFYNLNLLDTYAALIIADTALLLPYAIWLLREYFKTVPPALEEAAQIDGCSRLGSLFRIVLPLATPGLAATAIFVFLATWNEFFLAVLLTSSIHVQPITVIIASFITDHEVDYGLMQAAGVIAVLPPLILVLAFQKYIVKGLVSGALKG